MAKILIQDRKISLSWLLLLIIFVLILGLVLTFTVFVLNKAKDKSVSIVNYTNSSLELDRNINISIEHPKYYLLNQPFKQTIPSYFYFEYKYKDIYDNTSNLSDSSFGNINCDMENYSEDTILKQNNNYIEISENYTRNNFVSELSELSYQLADLESFGRYDSRELTIDGRNAVRTNIYNKDTNPNIKFMIIHIFNENSFIHCYQSFNYGLSSPVEITTFDDIFNSVRFN